MSVVAIVGRPNVGKSTIFNLLTRSKSAIVADFSGLTRDRKYGNLKDTGMTLIDTGGINEESDDMSYAIKEQTDLAIEESDLLLFVVDAIDGSSSSTIRLLTIHVIDIKVPIGEQLGNEAVLVKGSHAEAVEQQDGVCLVIIGF